MSGTMLTALGEPTAGSAVDPVLGQEPLDDDHRLGGALASSKTKYSTLRVADLLRSNAAVVLLRMPITAVAPVDEAMPIFTWATRRPYGTVNCSATASQRQLSACVSLVDT
jgi:hypothetical protein